MDLNERIPNNVNLSEDKKLQRDQKNKSVCSS